MVVKASNTAVTQPNEPQVNRSYTMLNSIHLQISSWSKDHQQSAHSVTVSSGNMTKGKGVDKTRFGPTSPKSYMESAPDMNGQTYLPLLGASAGRACSPHQHRRPSTIPMARDRPRPYTGCPDWHHREAADDLGGGVDIGSYLCFETTIRAFESKIGKVSPACG